LELPATFGKLSSMRLPFGRIWTSSLIALSLACVAAIAGPRAAAQGGVDAAARPQATLLLINADIHTMDDAHPRAQALAVLGDRLVAVGSDADVRPWIGDRTRVLDAGGKLVLPGFIDDHAHFLQGAQLLTQVDLHDVRSAAAFRDKLCNFATKMKPGEWILGGNWDEQMWSTPALPTRALIDRCTQDNPVWVQRHDGHMSLANSLALQLARVNGQTASPPGGVIDHDASGQPSGIFRDAAQGMVDRVIPAPSDQQMLAAMRAGLKLAAGDGVTTIQSMDLDYPARNLRLYQELERSGELTARFYTRVPIARWSDLARAGIEHAFGTPMVTVGSLKAFADGSLGSRTAYFFQPYSDNPLGRKNWRGLLADDMIPPEKIYNDVLSADRNNLQVCIHAIGDKANSMILDLYQRVEAQDGPRDRRFRIEHAQHVRLQDYERFARLGVIASVQPYHMIDDGSWMVGRIGEQRARYSYAFRTFLDDHVPLAFGTDWPVAPLYPLYGIYGAVTRATLDGKHPDGLFPEEKLTVQQAVYAYTMGSAYAGFEEKDRGSLTPGKYADFVTLDRDLFTIPPKDIWNARVLQTVVGGRIVFTRGDYPVDYSR
jgi:predicted amidohydrolase YtcJ